MCVSGIVSSSPAVLPHRSSAFLSSRAVCSHRHCQWQHLSEACASSLSRTVSRIGELPPKCRELQVQDKNYLYSRVITSLSVGTPSQLRGDERTVKDNLLSTQKSNDLLQKRWQRQTGMGRTVTLNHD